MSRAARMPWSRVAWLACVLLAGCVVEYRAIPLDATEGTGSSSGTASGDTTIAADGTADPSASGATAEPPLECDDGDFACEGECVDLGFDSENCGECGNSCLLGTECIVGECVGPCGPLCDDELHVCDGNVCRCRPELLNCSGVCVDAVSDPDHCGDCLEECGPAHPSCGDGECQANCADFDDACEGTCTSFQSDPFNCGICGRICGTEELCAQGQCVPYEPLDPLQCDRCPCPRVCDTLCCWSERLDTNVCIDETSCPVP